MKIKIEEGDIVTHKLTKEKLLVIQYTDPNFCTVNWNVKVRRSNWDIAEVKESELILNKKKGK